MIDARWARACSALCSRRRAERKFFCLFKTCAAPGLYAIKKTPKKISPAARPKSSLYKYCVGACPSPLHRPPMRIGDGGGGDARARSNGSPVPVVQGARLEVSGARRAEGAVQLAAPVTVCLCASATAAAAAPTTETTTLARSLASRSLACLFARSIARSLTSSGRRTATVAAAAATTATATLALALMARPFPSFKACGSK